MSRRSTLLREMLRQRHWQTYATFCRQYDHAARRTDPALVGRPPSRGQFARWLAGDLKGLPHPDHCRVLEAMFPALTAAQLFAGAAGRRDPDSDSGAGSDPDSGAGSFRVPSPVPSTTTAPADRAATAPVSATLVPSPPSLVAGTATGPGLQLHEEISMATEESARFARGARGGVDQDVLDQLGADVRQLAVDYLTRPPLALFSPLSRLRHEVFEMLDRRQRPELLPPLYGVAGRLCALLAHASADLGHDYAAQTHTRTAWLCADLADDDSLRAYVRWVQANVAFWNGDYRRAAEIAHSGQRYATKGTNRLRLASQEARALAACGDEREVERALATASATRAHHTPDHHHRTREDHPDASYDQAGVFRFDPGKAAYYASEVRLALGGERNARHAVACAEESLQLFEEGPEAHRAPEFVAAARLDLASAHLGLRDLEGAAEQLRTVLRLQAENRTQPIVSRVASCGKALNTPGFARSPLACELIEEMVLFRAYPAHRELPEVAD